MSSLQVISEGYKQTEVGIIPEDWDVKTFGQVMNIRHGKDQKSVQVTDGLYPIFGTGGQMGTTNTPLYDKPSVLIGRKGTINKPRFMDTPFWTVDTLFYSEVSSKDSAKFIYYKFCMIDWMQYNESSGVPSLNASTIESVFNSFPKLEEQTAIANALSDVDALLSELEKLIAKKQAIKTATMQQLLTGKTRLPPFAYKESVIYADGDKQGQIKGTKPSELGEIPEDWEVVTIESLCDLATGSTPSTNNVDNYGTEYLFTSPADLKGQKYIENTVKKLSHAGWSISRKYPPNSILFTCIGSTIGKCGMSRKWLTSNQQINAVFPSEKVIADYLYYQLSHAAPRIKEQAGEQAVPIINKTEFGKSLIFKPNNKKEQIAIATILSDMDEDIQALKQRLSKTRQIKQGMMQELLTGKTRLPFEKSGDMTLQGEPNAN